jgi:hypothetical protein
MADRAINSARIHAAADVERVAAANVRALLEEAGAARLLTAAGRSDLAEPVTRSAGRRLRRVLVAAGAAAVVVAGTVAPLGTPAAQALVQQTGARPRRAERPHGIRAARPGLQPPDHRSWRVRCARVAPDGIGEGRRG